MKLPMLDAPVSAPLLPVPDADSDGGAPKPCVSEPKIGRNDLCPCGSGKKYKKG